ncbi:MAG: glutamate--tRNA ligase [candidate division WS1 bacterium]|nr:glutamate--tRNA ligase [candidate division WS1 bacterium]
MNENIRTRFAPSPTGYMHIGNLHTALFEWLFARHEGGKFILRIEDTDVERHTPEAVQVIYDGLRWLGLDWDEGPDVGGPHGPYVQSERVEIYQGYLQQLVAEGKAYECYCTPEELTARREAMRARGEAPRYDNRCRTLTEAERAAAQAAGQQACVRLRMPEGGATVVRDLIQGEVSFENALVGDPVIGKTSGFPTYHMAVVVDDYLMQISHVIRAAEHLANTQVHMQIQAALDFPTPTYAHLPLILGEDRTKLSKRHGAVSVVEYQEKGFLPEALFNFLALLGWSPGGSEEVLSREEIIERFTLEACSASPAVFDLAKAEWLNSEYMKQMPGEEMATRLLPLLQEHGLMEAEPSPERLAWLAQVADLMKERAPLLTTYAEWARYFFTDDYEYDEKARDKWLTKPETPGVLRQLAERLETLAGWDAESVEGAVRGLAEEVGVGAGKVIHPCRAAVTGTTVGPSLFHLLELLPQETVVMRLRRAAEAFGEQ